MKTGRANREVYVITPAESKMGSTHRWLLLVAAYGLVNLGTQWQHQSDEAMFSLGLIQLKYIPQLFFRFDNDGDIQIILTKIVDYIIITGEEVVKSTFIEDFTKLYEQGKVVNGSGKMRFFCMNSSQNEDMPVEINADDKLLNIIE